jgi:hypothetical protein
MASGKILPVGDRLSQQWIAMTLSANAKLLKN